MDTISTAAVVRDVAPFLRWAGGKRWLLFQLPGLVAMPEFNNYHEPFLGGGSVFLGLNPTGTAYLSDLNVELIEAYQQVRRKPGEVADLLAGHPNSLPHYYAVRDESPSKAVERAARFIYLNHTSFNGIYRVNLDGKYNVPYGNREVLHIPTDPELKAISRRLRSAKLTAGDFADSIDNVCQSDLVFLDPPYTVAHNNNGFVKYNQRLFSFEDQRRLRALIDEIKSRGAFYIMTNAAHQSIADLFDCGDRRLEVSRRNTIGGVNANRGRASEFVFTNLPEPACDA